MKNNSWTELTAAWPSTVAALERHFLFDQATGALRDEYRYAAGSCSSYLERALKHAIQCHGPLRATRFKCDSLFAAEVAWQAARKSSPRNLCGFFGTCWFNICHERGERFAESASASDRMSRPSPPRSPSRLRSINEGSLGNVLGGLYGKN